MAGTSWSLHERDFPQVPRVPSALPDRDRRQEGGADADATRRPRTGHMLAHDGLRERETALVAFYAPEDVIEVWVSHRGPPGRRAPRRSPAPATSGSILRRPARLSISARARSSA